MPPRVPERKRIWPGCVICGRDIRPDHLKDSRCQACYGYRKREGVDRCEPLWDAPDDPVTTKKCASCHRTRPLLWFPQDAASCAFCDPPAAFAEAIALCVDDPARTAKRSRKYGITPADFDALYEKQEHRCGICRRIFMAATLVIDHDHQTGAVRGLLCQDCNLGLGRLGDSLEIARRAVAYLEACEPARSHQ